ncbi:MAG: hypothetical protein KA204_04695 [Chromatiaceae bacterium]|nr:hypothetical protein [Chromatiaceae bacterium]MBP6734647.1 hypothetical protein [Chromatiaceae bacterium]MBP6807413.1 hypothetical protein [Chromatiaceae bacterium]MBP8288948.1 hypothetical protein [Chromatiaceae bacterium]
MTTTDWRQEAGEVEKAPGRGKHRQRRARAAWPGRLRHQDASTHTWVPGVKGELMVTRDDATHAHYALRCVAEAGTAASLIEVRDVIERRGLFAALDTARGRYDWHPPRLAARWTSTL